MVLERKHSCYIWRFRTAHNSRAAALALVYHYSTNPLLAISAHGPVMRPLCASTEGIACHR